MILKLSRTCTALLPLLAHPAAAQGDTVKACLDLMSTAEQRDCMQWLYSGVSAEVDLVFQSEVERVLRPPEAGVRFGLQDRQKTIEAMNQSQSAWQAYRDAECHGVVGGGGGSGSTTWALVCLVEKARERIRELTVPIEKGR